MSLARLSTQARHGARAAGQTGTGFLLGSPALAPAPPPPAAMTETTLTRAVVTWEGPGEPIVLTVYGPDGEIAVALGHLRRRFKRPRELCGLTKRALSLAHELLTRGIGHQGGYVGRYV